MSKLFISYRRDDSADVTGRLHDRLKGHFGDGTIFLDIDTIPYGMDFRKCIGDAVNQCDVLLAVIGDRWLDARFPDGPQQGNRRLDDPHDYVRIEIESALARGIPVVPLLVGKASMPAEAQLPDALKELAFRHAAEARSGADFQPQVDRLIKGLELLQARKHELTAGVEKAIHIAREDPQMGLRRARMMLELALRDVYERRFHEPPGTRALENLVQRFDDEGGLPNRFDLAALLGKLNEPGPARWGGTVAPVDVQESLAQVTDILKWYIEVEQPDSLGKIPAQREEPRPVTTRAAEMRPATSEPRIAIVPKGLRSFDADDSDFFLQLLPGPRDKDGLPESIRFWKHRIESRDDPSFTVGVIYGPSGCGKSSLVKAGLLPGLVSRVVSVYVEATPSETEARILSGLRKKLPGLDVGFDLMQTIAALHFGQGLGRDQKVVLVIDQFEQWLHARRQERESELAQALRQCDGDRIQCLVTVRDDFWVSLSRFMGDLRIEILQGQNAALVDLFDPIHARNVLIAFGRAFGRLPAAEGALTKDQEAFVTQAIEGLAQDGRVISIRLALFADMVKGRPWVASALKEVGGAQGVGVAFLEETFASAALRAHQVAGQAVLKALLPESGSNIKGNMRSYHELAQAAGYADRHSELDALLRVLDRDLRLITPTEERMKDEGGRMNGENTAADVADSSPSPQRGEGARRAGEGATPAPDSPLRFYQLTHDYLVPALREWLTRKQKETRRGRAELRLADRTALWIAKPENRHLPSIVEWANIRLLTQKRNWSGTERQMMKRAGRLHGLRALGVAAGLAVLLVAGLDISRRVEEANQRTVAESLVNQVIGVKIGQVAEIVKSMARYRRWVDPALRQVIARSPAQSTEKLHASIALLPVDPAQADYLYGRLLAADADEVLFLRDALKPRADTEDTSPKRQRVDLNPRNGAEDTSPKRQRVDLKSRNGAEDTSPKRQGVDLVPKLWSVLESSKPGDASLLPAASALALYDPESERWLKAGDTVAEAMVQLNAIYLRPWLEALRPVQDKLSVPLAAIFRNTKSTAIEHVQATNILTDYASDDPRLTAGLLMDADPKAYAAFFPIVDGQAAVSLPVFEAEIAKKPAYSWDDAALDPSWTQPDSALAGKIEAAAGLVAERFAFCQTLPLHEFAPLADGLHKSGYRPIKFRPYADGPVVRVAAVWARDGRDWRIAHDQSPEAIRGTDQADRQEGFIPVDVAGYSANAVDGKSTVRYAALWVKKARADGEAQLAVAIPAGKLQKLLEERQSAGMAPLTLKAITASDSAVTYSAIWLKPARGAAQGSPARSGLSEADLAGQVSQQSGPLADLGLSAAARALGTKGRARAALKAAEAAVRAKPDGLDARYSRATAYLELGEHAKALDDFDAVVKKAPQFATAVQFRAIARARLGHKDAARADLAQFQKSTAAESAKLYLAVVVAAELGDGLDQAFEKLDAALKNQPGDAGLHYDAACAYALASRALGDKAPVKRQQLAERAISLLKAAIESGYSNYSHMQEDADLDPIRELAAFGAIMKAGHLERSYSAVWSSDVRFEAVPFVGLDPAAQLERFRELAAQGYRMVALSATRISPDAPPATASVWHRPVISEQARDQLAERQARAAVALVRLGKADKVWPLLKHSPDPRLRSFIVNWLKPLSADAGAVAAEFARLEAGARGTEALHASGAAGTQTVGRIANPSQQPVDGSSAPGAAANETVGRIGNPSYVAEGPSAQLMETALFHPDISIRRALILALGTYGPSSLSPGEREPLTANLLDLFKNDPDAGIHAAAEWALRQWNEQAKLQAAEATLPGLKNRGTRRWFANTQGEAFVLIEGPVEFTMGSPPTEPHHESDELAHRRRIPRKFAIAAKEVGARQYEEFVKENPDFGLDRSYLDKWSPDPDGPMVAVSWFGAVAYCNWLSKREGLPEDQWCYLRNAKGEYDQEMTIPADILKRKGYRLPTEAEWEYACRAGAVTSRYYGLSLDLLRNYARSTDNSAEHAWPRGSLLPNDLGLLDVLGNVYEWCNERNYRYATVKDGASPDEVNILEHLDINTRLLRGGSFNDRPAVVRSAYRSWGAPADRANAGGFRPARTYD